MFRDIEVLLIILYMVPSTWSSGQNGDISGESKTPNQLGLILASTGLVSWHFSIVLLHLNPHS